MSRWVRLPLFRKRKKYPSVSFFFNDTATPEIYTLSLPDALPISAAGRLPAGFGLARAHVEHERVLLDRKSTRLNSSHDQISYAVFCLKKNMVLPRRRKGSRKPPPARTVSIAAHSRDPDPRVSIPSFVEFFFF